MAVSMLADGINLLCVCDGPARIDGTQHAQKVLMTCRFHIGSLDKDIKITH